MTKRNYHYQGPHSGVTLDSGEEILLTQGKTVTLDDAHPYVVSLVQQKFLIPHDPIKPERQSLKAKSTPESSTA